MELAFRFGLVLLLGSCSLIYGGAEPTPLPDEDASLSKRPRSCDEIDPQLVEEGEATVCMSGDMTNVCTVDYSGSLSCAVVCDRLGLMCSGRFDRDAVCGVSLNFSGDCETPVSPVLCVCEVIP